MRRRLIGIIGCGLVVALVVVWVARTGTLFAADDAVGAAQHSERQEKRDQVVNVESESPRRATKPKIGEEDAGPAAAAADSDPLLQAALPPAEALMLLQWCGEMIGADSSAAFEAAWRWLGEDAARVERSRYAQARAWMSERCRPWTLAPDSERAQALKAELTRRAAQSADLRDQLRALELAPPGPAEADAIAARRQLEAALASGRPELLRDIGRVLERSHYADPELLGPYAGGGASSLFTLLACDLGMPCGADSEPVRLNCALRGVCGYADYETLLFDAWHGARAAQILQQHRALLLQRIRAGQIHGLFDPVPLPPKP
jgi:hypothetical protein